MGIVYSIINCFLKLISCSCTNSKSRTVIAYQTCYPRQIFFYRDRFNTDLIIQFFLHSIYNAVVFFLISPLTFLYLFLFLILLLNLTCDKRQSLLIHNFNLHFLINFCTVLHANWCRNKQQAPEEPTSTKFNNYYDRKNLLIHIDFNLF